MLLAALGGFLTWQNWGPESALDGSMVVLAVAVVLAVGLGLLLARRRGLTPSAAVGAATGTVFLIFAARAALLVAPA